MITYILPASTLAFSDAEFAAFCTHVERFGDGSAALSPILGAPTVEGHHIPPGACRDAATALRKAVRQTAIPGLEPFDAGKVAALISGLERAADTGGHVSMKRAATVAPAA